MFYYECKEIGHWSPSCACPLLEDTSQEEGRMFDGENEERYHDFSSMGENKNILGSDEEKAQSEISLSHGSVSNSNRE